MWFNCFLDLGTEFLVGSTSPCLPIKFLYSRTFAGYLTLPLDLRVPSLETAGRNFTDNLACHAIARFTRKTEM